MIFRLKIIKGCFSQVRFCAASNGSDVVFGYILDEDGRVESVASDASSPVVDLSVLPLTPNSKTLVAAMPLIDGKPEWDDAQVEFLTDGVISQVNNALNSIMDKLYTLEELVKTIFAATHLCEKGAAC